MASVRQEGTSAELRVRELLHGLGFRYRLNVENLPGKPDIANKWRKKAIFVHGCFWHHHEGCHRATVPKRNAAFWRKKFTENSERDLSKIQALAIRGFDVLVVWECELDDPGVLKRRLRDFWLNADERSPT